MYGTRNRSPGDMEVIDVLKEISRVSARLARNLTILAATQQQERRENEHEALRNQRRHPGP